MVSFSSGIQRKGQIKSNLKSTPCLTRELRGGEGGRQGHGGQRAQETLVMDYGYFGGGCDVENAPG